MACTQIPPDCLPGVSRSDAAQAADAPLALPGTGLLVLFVPGIATWPGRLGGWRRTLAEQLPGAQVAMLDEAVYWPWSHDTHRQIIGAGCQWLAQGRPTWLLAHSFGGLLARAMLSAMHEHQVRLMTTLASPHRLGFRSFGPHVPRPGAAFGVPVRALSYGGYLDALVSFPLTPLHGAAHTNLWCDHVGFLYRRKVRERVLADARAELRAG